MDSKLGDYAREYSQHYIIMMRTGMKINLFALLLQTFIDFHLD